MGADPRGCVREIGKILGLGRTAILKHLDAIGKVKKLDKMPHEFTEEQQKCHLEICSSLFIRTDNVPFIDRVLSRLFTGPSTDGFLCFQTSRWFPLGEKLFQWSGCQSVSLVLGIHFFFEMELMLLRIVGKTALTVI